MVLKDDPGSSELGLSFSRLQAPLIPAQLAWQRRGSSCKCSLPPPFPQGHRGGVGPLPRRPARCTSVPTGGAGRKQLLGPHTATCRDSGPETPPPPAQFPQESKGPSLWPGVPGGLPSWEPKFCRNPHSWSRGALCWPRGSPFAVSLLQNLALTKFLNLCFQHQRLILQGATQVQPWGDHP